MKKLCLLLALLLLFATGCAEKKPLYEPEFSVGEGYLLEDGTISGTVIGEEFISLFSVFTTYEDFIIFGDSTAETYLASGVMPLVKGDNHFVVRFYTEEAEREYDINIKYIPIRALSVELLDEEKSYRIGEPFDRSTIRVTAEDLDGNFITAEHYDLEYEFSELGEAEVGISLGDFYETLTVSVSGEYLPALDGSLCADGVRYSLKGETAVLLSATDAEGFFAVPRAVLRDGVEYPVTAIANGAFARTAVTGVLIPEGVESIGIGAFSGCALLYEVTLPETLVSLGKQAFSDCASLSRVELPPGLSMLDYGVFSGCETLFRVSLPEGLSVIGEAAFRDCKALSSIDIPKSVKEIGTEAFFGCEKLKQLVLPDLAALHDRAFADCKALSAVALGSAEAMGVCVFEGTDVTLYTRAGSALSDYEGVPYAVVGEVPVIVSLPTEFAVEEDYPYGEVLAFVSTEEGIEKLKNYEVSYPADACGLLTATLTYGDLSHSFEIFVSYTETALIDTDTRGAVYEIDPVTKTALLIDLPAYVRPSKVFIPEKEGLFLIPTHLSLPDGVYLVAGYVHGFEENCENVSEIFMPST